MGPNWKRVVLREPRTGCGIPSTNLASFFLRYGEQTIRIIASHPVRTIDRVIRPINLSTSKGGSFICYISISFGFAFKFSFQLSFFPSSWLRLRMVERIGESFWERSKESRYKLAILEIWRMLDNRLASFEVFARRKSERKACAVKWRIRQTRV